MNNPIWTVKYANEFNEQYYSIKNSKPHRHLNSEEWEVDNSDEVIQIVKDFLDVPTGELSLEQIKNDFGENRADIDESRYVQIQNYYNGRLALFNCIQNDILEFRDSEGENGKIFHYDIPEEYNQFYIKDEDRSVQNFSFIEITFKM